MVIRRAILLKSYLALMMFAAAPAFAQQADGVSRFSGTIEKIDGQHFTL